MTSCRKSAAAPSWLGARGRNIDGQRASNSLVRRSPSDGAEQSGIGRAEGVAGVAKCPVSIGGSVGRQSISATHDRCPDAPEPGFSGGRCKWTDSQGTHPIDGSACVSLEAQSTQNARRAKSVDVITPGTPTRRSGALRNRLLRRC